LAIPLGIAGEFCRFDPLQNSLAERR